MPEKREIVINTDPLIALVAAMGGLRMLDKMYTRVIVPHEVACEILVENATRFGSAEFEAASWLEKKSSPLTIAPSLANVLDLGEAAVIQWALNEGISTVCIDEAVGRRVARLNGLRVTGLWEFFSLHRSRGATHPSGAPRRRAVRTGYGDVSDRLPARRGSVAGMRYTAARCNESKRRLARFRISGRFPNL